MRYAEVSVNSPAVQRRSFSYSIPSTLNVEIGQAVRVPFGSRVLEGIIVEFTDFPAVEQTRDIEGIIEEKPVLSREHLALAKWISDYYLCPLFDALSLMLPPGSSRKSVAVLSLTKQIDNYDRTTLTEEQSQVIGFLENRDHCTQKDIEKLLGERKTQTVLSQLLNRSLVCKNYELEAARVKPKYEEFISLLKPQDNEPDLVALTGRSTKKATIIRTLIKHGTPVSWTALKQEAGVDRSTLNSLITKGIIKTDRIRVTRDPLSLRFVSPDNPLKLTNDQSTALKAIQESIQNPSSPDHLFLLHGVTGSGKTEVYLQALAETIRLGKRGIVLVPEISLTPQTIERFTARFSNRIAVLHSHLSQGEQFDEWHRIRNGEFDVVIGPRSALFAPQPDLGLIIIDEEHEWTYKQSEKQPRYHARAAAIKLAELTGSTVVLGSATPDLGTYLRAKQGIFHLLALPDRVTPVQHTPLPEVEIVDLKEELKSGGSNIFSRSLISAVNDAITVGEQVILFLNRRGASTFIQCRKCGLVLRCRRCEVSLTYHSANNSLVCHQCNYHRRMPDVCPSCSSSQIKMLGAGTQKLEEEAKKLFPAARILRWDSDATRETSHEEILRAFISHQADILIGTQMITKGLDIPNITVVGVINADIALNFPHFLAVERTFQLLSQVAGRAGRGKQGGRVILQTYNPKHFAIQAAAKHDYNFFYEQESAFRHQLGYPPFQRMASLVYSHSNDVLCQKEAERLKKELDQEGQARGITGLRLTGPAPAYIHRLRGNYRWQIVVCSPDPSLLLAHIPLPRGWILDIDPVGLT